MLLPKLSQIGHALHRHQYLNGEMYSRFVYLNTVPDTPGEGPLTSQQAPEGGSTQAQQSITRDEIQHILTSSRLHHTYGNSAFLDELLGGIPLHDRPEVVSDLQATVERNGGPLDKTDLLGSIARTYEQLQTFSNDDATQFLFEVSSLAGKNGPEQMKYLRPHPDVVRTVTKKIVFSNLMGSFEHGNIAGYSLTVDDLARIPASGATEQAKQQLIFQLTQEKVNRLMQTHGNFIPPYEDDFRRDYVGTMHMFLQSPGYLPPDLVEAIRDMPAISFQELAQALQNDATSLPFLENVRTHVENQVTHIMDRELDRVLNVAMERALYAGDVVTVNEFCETTKLQVGSVFTIKNQQDNSIGILSVRELIQREDDVFVHVGSAGEMAGFSSRDFLQMWEAGEGSILVEEPMTQDSFFEAHGIDKEKYGSVSKLMLQVSSDTLYPITHMKTDTVRFGKATITWAELEGFLKHKEHDSFTGVTFEELQKNSAAEGKRVDEKPKGFYESFLSVMASPRQLFAMANNVFEYFKDEFESNEKERTYMLLRQLTPEGILRDEFEAKLASIQDEQMNSKLDVIKKRTSGQVAKFAERVFLKARNGGFPPVSISMKKAALIALLQRGGELYYGDMFKYRGTFFVYEALGGRIGDATYNKILAQDREANNDPTLKEPQEWRCIMEFLAQHSDEYGPTFDDMFDGEFNGAGDPQMNKHKGLLADVNNRNNFVKLTVDEVHKGRFWRALQGFDSSIARAQGMNTHWEIFFHMLAYGDRLEDKQRKHIKINGVINHAPYLAQLATLQSTRDFQKTMSIAINTLASSPNYASSVRAGGRSIDLTTFKFEEFARPGSGNNPGQIRAILSAIYAEMGDDLLEYISGKSSLKMVAKEEHKSGVASLKGALEAYEPGGDYDDSTFEYFNLLSSNPETRGGGGIFSQILTPTQMSGSFAMTGKAKAEKYLDNFIEQMGLLNDVVTGRVVRDPMTGQAYTSQELTNLREYHGKIIADWMKLWVNRMDRQTYKAFLNNAYSKKMEQVGFRFPPELSYDAGTETPNYPHHYPSRLTSKEAQGVFGPGVYQSSPSEVDQRAA